MRWRLRRSTSRLILSGIATSQLIGCASPRSPSVPLFGAYFPSWLLCALVGVFGAIIVRIILVRLGVDDGIPYRLAIYTCVAATIGLALALTVFGR